MIAPRDAGDIGGGQHTELTVTRHRCLRDHQCTRLITDPNRQGFRAFSFIMKTPTRTPFAVPLLALISVPCLGQPVRPDDSAPAAGERNAARWADREAQSRMIEGDYDGAIQANQQADADRNELEQQERLARSPKR
ncbi:MAG: hypothetical protein ABSC06_02825 [Rhodopila sp.]|jgi:hypothetical protein